MRKLWLAVALAALLGAGAVMGEAEAKRSKAPKDPFVWLEEVEGERALEWVRAHNEPTLAALQSDSRFAKLEAEALAIVQDKRRLALGEVAHGFLWNFWQDQTNVRGLWRRSPIAAYAAGKPEWETILDIDALAKAEGKNWVFKGYTCLEPERRLCMIALSDGGKDAVVWREFDMLRKSFYEPGFKLAEGKSGVVWKDINTLMVTTDLGPGSLTESGYPYILKAWSRGQFLADAPEVLRGQPTDVSLRAFKLRSETGEERLFAVEGNTFFTSTYWLLDGDAPAKLTLPEKASVQELHKDELIFTIEQEWAIGGRTYPQGALLSMPLKEATSAAPTIRLLYGPGPRESLEGVTATRDAVLVAAYRDVKGQLLRFSFDGRAWFESQVPMPNNGSIGLAGADPTESLALITYQGFDKPSTLFALDGRLPPRPVQALPEQFDATGVEVSQFEATSRDGTKVPYFIVRPKGAALDGSTPTLLYGYGGFQISQTPSYSSIFGKLWLERGGAYVIANIRGGGEFGPAWHQAGLKTKRQVVYDDFIAVAEDLIARKLTSPRRLGIMGGSNGGLLMGAMLTQRPELFHAAVVQVPLLDMLRYHLLLAGASWIDEYGDPRVPEERAWLEQLSPYNNLVKRADFPVPFIVTSTKDDRVHPAHARKYAAKMEKLGLPFFYYENTDGGHAAAANPKEVATRRALEFTYLSQRLMD